MKKWKLLVFAVLIVTLLAGCGKKTADEPDVADLQTTTTKAETTTKETTTVETTTEETTTEDPWKLDEGMMYSKLTGLPVTEEIGKRRPIAVMISNLKVVDPQDGIGSAVILYEALVEGGITRTMGIFEEFDNDRIGSVRSARHDFISASEEYDAILCHIGSSNIGDERIAKLKVNDLDGLKGAGVNAFYRDNSIKMPHNAFTSYDRIMKCIDKAGYRMEAKDLNNHFTFYHEDTELTGGETAKKVTLHLSNYNSPYFTYDEEQKIYKRYQFGHAHKDKSTGEQLAFKNLIILVAPCSVVDNDGHVNYEMEENTGKGYYVTDGKYVPITWEKSESKQFMQYYDESGELLTINPGKTYICLYPEYNLDKLEFADAE
ncbi:MAG: DUF3048 domain-containing protein [Lachnospiraceae bacterium]|nr:DUF3048 domain-containing protein [Lachnospiraceae bacterium]